MATDTAAAPPAPAPVDHTRHLWQLPALLLGGAAFVCAWQGWLPPFFGPGNPSSKFGSDVAALKASYDKISPDATDLKNWLNRVASGVDAHPEQAAPAHFHLGSGYVRLAELTPAPDEAAGYWTLAKQHFEWLKDKQLKDPGDGPKLAFRAAKARAAAGLPPETTAADISLLINVLSAPQTGEEAGETHRLIADLALRLNPPDFARAKVALTQYLTTTGVATPAASLARARLRLGDLHLYLKEYEQARKWLKEIGPDATPDVLAPARAELAQVHMAESNWAEAAKELELLRGTPNVPQAMRLHAAYQFGVCKVRLREADAAAKLFEEAAKGGGPEASAAAVQLATLHLGSADPARHKAAVELLASAVKGVRNPAAYDDALVPLGEAQAAFEQAITTLLLDGAHESAMKAAEAYAAVAAPGRDRERRAEVLGAWGEAIVKSAKSGTPRVGDSRAMFRAAADEFAALADYQPKVEGKLELFRRSAALSRKADDAGAAASRLREAVKLPGIPEQTMPAVWVELADALLAANKPEDVFKIFNKIMAEHTDLSTATRYRLARVFVDSRHAGLAPLGRALFEQIAKQQNVTAAEREYHERALTELANALIREGNFADAEARLRTQLGTYPNGPEAPLARLLLGVCLLQRAAAPGTRDADAVKMRNEGLASFKQIVSDCDAIERRNGKLTERESQLRLQAGLRVLQSYQQMRTQQGARELLGEAYPLLDRHRNTVEELIILSLVYHAWKQLNDSGNAFRTRDRMKETFEKLPPSAFPQKTGEYSRDYWQKVWFPPEKEK